MCVCVRAGVGVGGGGSSSKISPLVLVFCGEVLTLLDTEVRRSEPINDNGSDRDQCRLSSWLRFRVSSGTWAEHNKQAFVVLEKLIIGRTAHPTQVPASSFRSCGG